MESKGAGDSLGQITCQKAGKEDWKTEPHFGRKY